LKPLVAPDAPGGAVIVIQDGKVVAKTAVGLANREDKTPNTPATNFRLASVTKQFTAMAILMLIEEGKLSYATKLGDLFPDFPAYGKDVTIRHLLSHIGGLPEYEDHVPSGTTKQLKDQDVMSILGNQKGLMFAPGAKYKYSNSGYAILALAVEKASGQKFADFLKKRIFSPLHMDNTLAFEEGGPPIVNRAYGYAPSGKGFKRTDQSLTSAVLGDGGIYSSVEDMRKWDEALYAPNLIRPETLTLAFTGAKLNDGSPVHYGFGWELETHKGLQCVHHGGSTVGFRNEIERFPAKKLTVILLCNRSDAKPKQIATKIADMFLSE
jgi:CubicO group peptidase (beta-lactamase class C family)